MIRVRVSVRGGEHSGSPDLAVLRASGKPLTPTSNAVDALDSTDG